MRGVISDCSAECRAHGKSGAATNEAVLPALFGQLTEICDRSGGHYSTGNRGANKGLPSYWRPRLRVMNKPPARLPSQFGNSLIDRPRNNSQIPARHKGAAPPYPCSRNEKYQEHQMLAQGKRPQEFKNGQGSLRAELHVGAGSTFVEKRKDQSEKFRVNITSVFRAHRALYK